MRKIVIYILLLNTTAACQGFLDQEPQAQVSKNEALADMQGVEYALNGTYGMLSVENTLYEDFLTYYADLTGGNMQLIRRVPNDVLPMIEKFNSDATLTSQAYTDLYAVLNAVNNIIEVTPTLKDGTPQQKDQVRGEALALRGLIHFELLRLYAQPYNFTADASHTGVVILTESILPTAYRSRIPVAEGYDQVLSDLNEAADLLEESTFGPKRMSRLGVKALLSRVYLYQQEYAMAAAAATAVINSELELASTDEYPLIWQNGYFEKEYIFRLTDASSNNKTLSTKWGHEEVNAWFSATPDIVKLFDSGDIRRQLLTPFTHEGDDYYSTQKYPATDGLRPNHISVLRLSEIYLNRAEAYAALGRTELAQNDLNKIIERAKPSAEPVYPTGEALMERILLERRKELAFEGHLLFDLTRHKKGVERNYCEGSLNCDMPYPSDQFVLPIPISALEGNPELEQNKGY